MSSHVYILRSVRRDRYYIGSSENVDKRVKEHNRGRVKSTKAYRPYVVVHTEIYLSKTDALRRERYLKSPSGWRDLQIIKARSRGFPEGITS